MSDHRGRYVEKRLEYAIVVDKQGKILHNAAQQDTPIIRREYPDGVFTLINERTGEQILKPHRYNETGDLEEVEGWTEPDFGEGQEGILSRLHYMVTPNYTPEDVRPLAILLGREEAAFLEKELKRHNAKLEVQAGAMLWGIPMLPVPKLNYLQVVWSDSGS